MPAVVRRAGRLGGLPKRAIDELSGIIPSSMRYTQTLPDGREVFLALAHGSNVRQPMLRLLIVAADGSWRDGQPIVGVGMGLPDNRIALREALRGGGCSTNMTNSGSGHGLTEWNIEPNGVARVRWQFAGQTQPVTKPLTLDVPVRGNTAVATVPHFANCEQKSAVTLYNHDGQIIASHGHLPPARPAVNPPVARTQVATTVTARTVPARHYCQPRTALADWSPCNTATPAAEMRTAGIPQHELVQVSFTARLAAGKRQNNYEFHYTNPDNGGGFGLVSQAPVTAGQHITTQFFVSPRRSGHYTGSITYQAHHPGPPMQLGTSPQVGATLVGRFSFNVAQR